MRLYYFVPLEATNKEVARHYV